MIKWLLVQTLEVASTSFTPIGTSEEPLLLVASVSRYACLVSSSVDLYDLADVSTLASSSVVTGVGSGKMEGNLNFMMCYNYGMKMVRSEKKERKNQVLFIEMQVRGKI